MNMNVIWNEVEDAPRSGIIVVVIYTPEDEEEGVESHWKSHVVDLDEEDLESLIEYGTEKSFVYWTHAPEPSIMDLNSGYRPNRKRKKKIVH